MRRPLAVLLPLLALAAAACPLATGGLPGSSSGAGGGGGPSVTQSSSSSVTSSSAETSTSSSATTSSSSSTTSSTAASTTSSTSASTTSSAASTGSGSTSDPNVCPGQSVTLDAQVTIMASTATASDKFKTGYNVGSCSTGTYSGPDLIYAVTPTTSGLLTATLSSTFGAPAVEMREACDDTSPEIACAAQAPAGAVTFTYTVVANKTYYVIVDSWQNKSGDFALALFLN